MFSEVKKSPQRNKLERADTTKSNSPSLTGNFLDVPRSDTMGSMSGGTTGERRPGEF